MKKREEKIEMERKKGCEDEKRGERKGGEGDLKKVEGRSEEKGKINKKERTNM